MNRPRPAEQMACGSPLGDDRITFLWLRSFISPTLLHLCIVFNALEVPPTCCRVWLEGLSRSQLQRRRTSVRLKLQDLDLLLGEDFLYKEGAE